MDKQFIARTRIIFYIIILNQLHTISCSRLVYTGRSIPGIETPAEKRKLEEFRQAGTGRTLNSGSTSPRQIIETARKYLGVPHCMGGTTNECIDCSGLLQAVFARHGIQLPHNSEEQARYGEIIYGKELLSEGDLVFFIRTYQTRRLITHSGIYTGNNQFIHASSSRGVTITSLDDPWWKERFIFGTRIFNQ